MEYRLNLSGCCMKHKGCSGLKIKKLNTFDWLCDLPQAQEITDWVEVQFKNTRKGYYLNSNKISIQKGDIIAVESSPGHDIGEVTLTGALVLKQMKKNNYRYESHEVRRVYRKARPVDLEKYEESKAMEHDTMLRSRKIAESLNLNMKIGDVEYQGDGNKAIFYYIADDRVDFRQLIKVLADTFKIRIEMKQIGARQETGRIGGVGPCGRELCCSSWMTNFISVSTSAARYQDLSLNPQKLAGQCAKLKCCLNYETDMYAEAQREFPSKDIQLETQDASYFLFKSDYLKRTITYSTSKDILANAVTIPLERAKQIITLNRKGVRVESLADAVETEPARNEFGDILGQDALNRFDKKKPNRNRNNEPNQGNRQEMQQGNRNASGERPNRPQGDRNRDNNRRDGGAKDAERRPERTRNEQGQRTDSRNEQRPRNEQRNRNEQQPRPDRNLQVQPLHQNQSASDVLPQGDKKEGKSRDRRDNRQGGGSRFEKPQRPGSAGNDTENNA